MNAPADLPLNVPETAALPVTVRAATALKSAQRESALVELAKRSAGITTITNKAGYEECHAARMVLKNERIEIAKDGKEARDDAQKFAKAVIAEEARLIALIEPEEKRLQAIQDAHDAKVEAEKKAKIEADAARISGINKRLDWIRGRVVELAGKPAAEIAASAEQLAALPITAELYGEFLDAAVAAKASTLDKLEAMGRQAKANEAEATRLAEERRKLDEQQAEQRRQDQERADRIAREDADRAYLISWDDAHREYAQRIEDAAREAQRAIDEAARKFLADWDDAIREYAQRAEDARQAAARAEAQRQEQLAREAREREETAARQARQNERAELERKADPWGTLHRVVEIAETAAGGDAAAALAEVLSVIGTAFLAREALIGLDAKGRSTEAAESELRG